MMTNWYVHRKPYRLSGFPLHVKFIQLDWKCYLEFGWRGKMRRNAVYDTCSCSLGQRNIKRLRQGTLITIQACLSHYSGVRLPKSSVLVCGGLHYVTEERAGTGGLYQRGSDWWWVSYTNRVLHWKSCSIVDFTTHTKNLSRTYF